MNDQRQMALPKPPGECHSESDRDYLARWTNWALQPSAALREMSVILYEKMPEPDDANYNAWVEEYKETRELLDEMPDPDDAIAATEAYYGRILKRGRVVIALRDLVALIGDDPELQKLAMREIAELRRRRRKPDQPRGRTKGERHHKGELTTDERRRCKAALTYEARILELWDLTFGEKDKGRRYIRARARDIALASQGLNLDTLDVYRANN
jgi:hypothetical protein